MTGNEMEYILKIAECQNVTKAAKELYISQPALSQMVSKIETQYQKPLFFRTNQGLILTEFGTYYVATVKQILSRYHAFENELEDFRTLKKGEIRFGLPQYLGTMILPTILPIFASKYPHVDIQYYENTSLELNQMLQNGKIDFAILHHHEQAKNAKFESLLEDPFYLVTPNRTQNLSEVLPVADLQKFSDENFILISKGHRSRDVADTILQKADITPSIRYTTKNMETAKRLVASGLGVTFLPSSFLSLFPDMKGLCACRLPAHLQASWELVLSYQKGTHLSATTAEFMELLKNSLSNML